MSNSQIDKAVTDGRAGPARLWAEAANQIGATYYQALALIEQESGGGNIWGSDAGGTFSGLKDLVTEASFRAFRHEVMVRGRPSNGVGPCQITYPGFFKQMETEGLFAWRPGDNAYFGVRLYWGFYGDARLRGMSTASAIRAAGSKYNTGSFDFAPYGDQLLAKALRWKSIVGTSDARR